MSIKFFVSDDAYPMEEIMFDSVAEAVRRAEELETQAPEFGSWMLNFNIGAYNEETAEIVKWFHIYQRKE